MSKILDINCSLQTPNMVFKSNVDNSIQQITDKAQNIAFVQSDVAKRPVYNYDGYIDFTGGEKKFESLKRKSFDDKFIQYPIP